MEKYTRKQLKELVSKGIANDITYGNDATRKEIIANEEYLEQIGYAECVYGCSGMLFVGKMTGKLYAITNRTTAIYIFG